MHGRRVLVIASNDAKDSLQFIPKLPQDLFRVLTDPNYGNCDRRNSAIEINRKRADVESLIGDFLRQAANDRDHLLLYFIGHGVIGEKRRIYYFGESSLEGVNITETIGRSFDGGIVPPGLALFLDTCHSGQGAMDAAELCGDNTQFATVAAVNQGLAYDGDFTRRLITYITNSENEMSGETISLESVADRIADELTNQQRPHYQHAKLGGRAVPYLSRNSAFNGLGGRTRPAHFQMPGALTAIVNGLHDVNTVHVVGPFGSGKTTLAVELTRAFGPSGDKKAGFLHATAFLTPNTTIGALAADLSAQLAVSFGPFRTSLDMADTQPRRSLDAQNPLDTLVLQPLAAMRTRDSVRILIDGYGEPSGCDEERVRMFLGRLSVIPQARLVVFGEKGHTLPGAGSRVIDLTRADEGELANFLTARGIADGEVRQRILRLGKRNWSLTSLLAAIAENGGSTEHQFEQGVNEYFRLLLERLEDDRWTWQDLLGPVLGVAALAGKGPVMPIEVLTAASARLGGPSDPREVQGVLQRLGELVERSDEDRPTELAGLANADLADYLFKQARSRHLLDSAAYERALLYALEKEAPRNEMWMGRAASYAAKREATHMANLHDPALLDSLRLRELRNVSENLARWEYWKTRLEASDGDRSLACLFADFQIERYTLEILNRNPQSEPEKAIRRQRCLGRMKELYATMSKLHRSGRARLQAGFDWCRVIADNRSTNESMSECEKLAKEARGILQPEDVLLLEIEGLLLIRREETHAAYTTEELLGSIDSLLVRVRAATSERSRHYLSLRNFQASLVGKSDPDAAVAILQEVLKVQRTMSADDDEAVLDTRHNIVAFRRKSIQEGQLQKAFHEIGPLVRDQQMYFGGQHFLTIQTRLLDARLGFLHRFRDDSSSLALFDLLLTDARAVLDEGHEYITRIDAWGIAVKRRLAVNVISDSLLIATIDALHEAGVNDPGLEELLRPAKVIQVQAAKS